MSLLPLRGLSVSGMYVCIIRKGKQRGRLPIELPIETVLYFEEIEFQID
jgi:hypothetical protein